jgi:hypothetical protein
MPEVKLTEETIQLILTSYPRALFYCHRYVAVPNVSYGLEEVVGKSREVDLLLLSTSGWFSSIEIKTSKEDLIKDKDKYCHTLGPPPGIRDLWFAVPDELKDLALTEVPPQCGIVLIHRTGKPKYPFKGIVLRKPTPNNIAPKATDRVKLKFMRLGVMRMWYAKLRMSRVKV